MLPLFEGAGKRDGGKKFIVGKDFYLAFSPEREDPNNSKYNTATIPKVVGGVTPECVKVAAALYNNVVVKTVPVSSTRAAEATKLTENIYRSVNIALSGRSSKQHQQNHSVSSLSSRVPDWADTVSLSILFI